VTTSTDAKVNNYSKSFLENYDSLLLFKERLIKEGGLGLIQGINLKGPCKTVKTFLQRKAKSFWRKNPYILEKSRTFSCKKIST